MSDCIFCKIIKGDIPSEFVYEDDLIVAFKDINPVSPTHLLIITKRHIKNIMELNAEEMANILAAIKQLSIDYEIDVSGFRVVNNCGPQGGQEVPHVHFHLLGGRSHTWPPG